MLTGPIQAVGMMMSLSGQRRSLLCSGSESKVLTGSPLDSQVGGRHYKQYRIQPIEYAMANKLNYCQANAIKYVTRYRDKNGIEDLRKAIHNIEILIELESREREQVNQGVRQETPEGDTAA